MLNYLTALLCSDSAGDGLSMHTSSCTESLWTRCLENCSWEFHKLSSSVQFVTKMNWLDFEVKGQGSRSQWDLIWLNTCRHFARHFLSCLRNASTNFNETYHNYLLPHQHDTHDVFKYMQSKINVTDNIF